MEIFKIELEAIYIPLYINRLIQKFTLEMSHFLPNFIFRYTTIPVKEIQTQKIPLTTKQRRNNDERNTIDMYDNNGDTANS